MEDFVRDEHQSEKHPRLQNEKFQIDQQQIQTERSETRTS